MIITNHKNNSINYFILYQQICKCILVIQIRLSELNYRYCSTLSPYACLGNVISHLCIFVECITRHPMTDTHTHQHTHTNIY